MKSIPNTLVPHRDPSSSPLKKIGQHAKNLILHTAQCHSILQIHALSFVVVESAVVVVVIKKNKNFVLLRPFTQHDSHHLAIPNHWSESSGTSIAIDCNFLFLETVSVSVACKPWVVFFVLFYFGWFVLFQAGIKEVSLSERGTQTATNNNDPATLRSENGLSQKATGTLFIKLLHARP